MKSRLEILDESVKVYSIVQNRAIDKSGRPFYNLELSNGTIKNCSIGRCLKTPKPFEKKHTEESIKTVDNLDRYLKEEYRGHKLHFWVQMQNLHDENKYWSKTKGLSVMGQEYVDKLKVEYEDHS